jgi:hypothetical protein
MRSFTLPELMLALRIHAKENKFPLKYENQNYYEHEKEIKPLR